MLENNVYNIDREFDYDTIKDMALKSLLKIAKEDVLKKSNVHNDYCAVDDKPDNIKTFVPPSPLLKLKIRNTTKYLNWRLSILKRDNFACKICHFSVKENKSLRLEVHHAKNI